MNRMESMQCMNTYLHLAMHELLRNLHEQHELLAWHTMHEYFLAPCKHELLLNLHEQHESFGIHAMHEYLIAPCNA